MVTIEACRARYGEKLKSIARELHMHPELSMQEQATTALIRSILRELGIEEIELGLATGVVGLLRGGRPGSVIGLRADIDALCQHEETDRPDKSLSEGKMHACGHDVHTVSLLGTAMLLADMREELSGNVALLFQPAEETLSGARYMLDRGLLERVHMDALFGLHNTPHLPVGTIGLKQGHLMAAKDLFSVRITGRGGHSSAPHKNIDPVVAAAAVIQGIHTIVSRNVGPLQSAVVNVSYMQGGSPEDLVVDEAVLRGSIRTHTQEVRKQVLERLEQVASFTAQAYGCTAVCEHESVTPAVDNPPALYAIAKRAAAELVGEANIRTPQLNMASEDFALFAKRIPGFFYFLGSGAPGARNYSWHHPQFAAHPDTPLYGATLLAQSVLCAQSMLE